MTVAQLVAELKKLPQDLPVTAEGADCGGYDVVAGTNVYVENREWDEGSVREGLPVRSVHIAHQEQ